MNLSDLKALNRLRQVANRLDKLYSDGYVSDYAHKIMSIEIQKEIYNLEKDPLKI